MGFNTMVCTRVLVQKYQTLIALLSILHISYFAKFFCLLIQNQIFVFPLLQIFEIEVSSILF